MAHATIDRWCAVAASAVLAVPAQSAAQEAAREPTIIEVQQAAARLAGGDPSGDGSRLSRARAAHWAPVLRAQVGRKDDVHVRDGQFRGAPVQLTDGGNSISWGISATWDLPQAIYGRDEAQLGHAQVHLAKARQQAASEASRLFLERREKRRALQEIGPEQAAARARLMLEILRLTSELEVRTGGLFRAALESEEAESVRAAQAASRAAPPLPTTTPGKVK